MKCRIEIEVFVPALFLLMVLLLFVLDGIFMDLLIGPHVKGSRIFLGQYFCLIWMYLHNRLALHSLTNAVQFNCCIKRSFGNCVSGCRRELALCKWHVADRT